MADVAQLTGPVVFAGRHVRHQLRPGNGTYTRTWCSEPLYMHRLRPQEEVDSRDFTDCLRCADAMKLIVPVLPRAISGRRWWRATYVCHPCCAGWQVDTSDPGPERCPHCGGDAIHRGGAVVVPLNEE